jgi:1-deoxy-D-xylulose-5-phosphate reductoisomerase
MTSSPRRIIILGVTGTVGVRALQILQDSPLEWQILGVSAHSQREKMRELAPDSENHFLSSCPEQHCELLSLLRAGDYDICLNAVVGAAGLPFSAAVLSAGCDLALANKESLVMAGSLLISLAEESGATIVPVDSEHSAIFQCLRDGDKSIRQLLLTASGGALRDLSLEQLDTATPELALAHPNWDMGPRITIDSATMMNKAFEIIEAHWLFNVDACNIKVLIHRQSIIHSMVEFIDGSVIAQLGPPDMGFPLHFALHYPGRHQSQLQGFDSSLYSALTLEEPDLTRYPALGLAENVIERGGDAGAVLNAADEMAVAAFLDGDINFGAIHSLCAAALENCCMGSVSSIDEIIAADERTRKYCSDTMSIKS